MKREHIGIPSHDRFQSQLETTIAKVTSFPDTNASGVTVTFTAGQTIDIPHKLGRAWQGWYVTRAVGGAWAGYESTTQPTPTQSIRLTSANAGTFTFRFF